MANSANTEPPNDAAVALEVHKSSDDDGDAIIKNIEPKSKRKKVIQSVNWRKNTSLTELSKGKPEIFLNKRPYIVAFEAVEILNLFFNVEVVEIQVSNKFEMYMGPSKSKGSRKPLGSQVVVDLLPLGSQAVADLLSVVETQEITPCSLIIFLDPIIYFETYIRVQIHWTIKENRILKCPLHSSKVVARKDCGFYDSRSDEFLCIVQ